MFTDSQRSIISELRDTPIPETHSGFAGIEADLERLRHRGIVECETIHGTDSMDRDFSVDVWTLTDRGHRIAERHGIHGTLLSSDQDLEDDMILATQGWK